MSTQSVPMPVACSTSAFRETLDQALPRVAELGFTHVDLIAIKGWPHVDLAALPGNVDGVAESLGGMLQDNNLTPVAFNVGLPTCWDRSDAEQNELRKTQADALCRLASRIGVKVASFYPGYHAPDKPAPIEIIDTLAETCREMLDIGRQHGITFGPEPHFATAVHTLDNTLALLDRAPEVTIAYDPSHYVMQGHGTAATLPLLERASHVHLRDCNDGKIEYPFGEGTLDFAWIVAELKRRGYTGALSIEYLPKFAESFGRPVDDSLTGLRDRLVALQKSE